MSFLLAALTVLRSPHCPSGYCFFLFFFNPTSPFTTKTPGFIPNPKFEDKVHCVPFVLDGSTIDLMAEKILTQIKAIKNVTNLKSK